VCGWRPRRKPASVAVIDGDLGRVNRQRQVDIVAGNPHQFYCELVWLADTRGYKRGWAAHKFKEKFGAWPSWRDPPPAEASPATMAWVRSRQIAYAKAMQARGVA
jgi:hypothetical protein